MGNEVPKIPKNRSQSAVFAPGRLRHVEVGKYYDKDGNECEDEDDEDEEQAASPITADAEDSPPIVVVEEKSNKKPSLLSSISKRMSRSSIKSTAGGGEDDADTPKLVKKKSSLLGSISPPSQQDRKLSFAKETEAAPVETSRVVAASEPVATQVEESAVVAAPEPVVVAASEPVVTQVEEPAVVAAPGPVVAPEAVIVAAPEPIVAPVSVVHAPEPIVAAPEPVVTVSEPVVVEAPKRPTSEDAEEEAEGEDSFSPVLPPSGGAASRRPSPRLSSTGQPVYAPPLRSSLVPQHKTSLLPSHRASLIPANSLPLVQEDTTQQDEAPSSLDISRAASSGGGGDAAAPKKKFTFTPLKLPKCDRCGKDVDKLDLVKDGKEIVFHKNCLKCHTCNVSLARREKMEYNPNLTSAWHMTHSQFIESEDGQYYCNKHNPLQEVVRRSSIKTQDIGIKYVQEGDLIELGHARKETNQRAKSVLEQSGGVTNEILCGRCGNSIEVSQAISVSGLERFHQICPSKEEIERSNKSLKYFLKKLPDHMAVQLQWDAELTKRTHTFLFLLDKETWKKAHLSTGNTCQVEYFPDPDAADPVVHNFKVPRKRGFDAKVKHYPAHFTFTNSRTKQEVQPTYDEDTGELKITKYSLANGVHQSVVIYFIYNEYDPEDPIQSERVILSFEKDVADADPLQALREQRRKTATKIEMPDLGDTIFASLDEADVIHEDDEFDASASSAMKPPTKMSMAKPRRTTGVLMQMQAASQLELAAAQAQAQHEATAAQVAAANSGGGAPPAAANSKDAWRRRQTQTPNVQNFDGLRSKFNNNNAPVPSAFVTKPLYPPKS